MEHSEHAERLLSCAHAALAPHYLYLYDLQMTGREMKVTVYNDTKEVTHFSISWLPGNPKVVIFHAVAIDPAYRGKGLGDFFHRIRLAIAYNFGATTALCTTRVGNSVERRILEKNGWSISFSVTDDVIFWARPLGNRGQK